MVSLRSCPGWDVKEDWLSVMCISAIRLRLTDGLVHFHVILARVTDYVRDAPTLALLRCALLTSFFSLSGW